MASSPTHKNLGSLIESPESASYSFTKNGITQTRIYHATLSVCLANVVYPGAAGTGDQTGYSVQSCEVTPLGSQQARLTIIWEATGAGSGATLPPDEVMVQGDNQSPRIERHPIFKPLELLTVGTEDVLDVVENVVRAQEKTVRTSELAKLTPVPLALKLIKKIQQGNESWYMATLRTGWTTHSWTIPTLSRGGFREPVQGPLASYFVADIDWLREADDLQYSNGIWRWGRSWLGSPLPGWDPDVYVV